METYTTLICENCAAEFNPGDDRQGIRHRQQHGQLCPACMGHVLRKADLEAKDRMRLVDEKHLALVRAEREGVIARICPPLMMQTDPSRLPQEKLAEVLAWEYGAEGLILYGDTRTGKTRCAFELLKREMRTGRRAAYIDGGTITATLRAAATDYFGGDAELLKEWEMAPFLLYDDLGKAGIGDHYESAIFGLINARIMACRPTIFTTNANGAALAGAMSEDRAAPFVARLREFNRTISFKAE